MPAFSRQEPSRLHIANRPRQATAAISICPHDIDSGAAVCDLVSVW